MTRLLTILLAGGAMMLMGCAEQSSSPQTQEAEQPSSPQEIPDGGTPIQLDPNTGGWVPSGDGPGQGPGSDWQYGGAAPLTFVSVTRLMEYTQQARNNPTDARINVNLENRGNNKYGGTVSIEYKDYGEDFKGTFTAGSSEKDAKYNVFLTKNGKRAFHGFFEDGLGAIILVIDDIEIEGDGIGPNGNASGHVYFKNFDPNYVPDYWTFWPGTTVKRAHCWFISLGPNDCRAWKKGNGVDTYKAIYPDSGYKKLGSFQNLNLQEAFNGDVSL